MAKFFWRDSPFESNLFFALCHAACMLLRSHHTYVLCISQRITWHGRGPQKCIAQWRRLLTAESAGLSLGASLQPPCATLAHVTIHESKEERQEIHMRDKRVALGRIAGREHELVEADENTLLCDCLFSFCMLPIHLPFLHISVPTFFFVLSRIPSRLLSWHIVSYPAILGRCGSDPVWNVDMD